MSDAPSAPFWQEPLPKEGPKPWQAFCRYRDLGSGRSLDKVGQELVKSVSLLSRWSAAYAWVQRAAAYDAHQALLVRKAAEAEHAAKLTAYRERAAKIGGATAEVCYGFLVKAGQRLKTLDVETIPIPSLPAFLRAAAAIAQASLAVEAEALGVRELEKLLDDEDAAEGAK